MIDRLINLPFKIIGKAARAVQERQDASDRERAEKMTAASRERSNAPAVEVPDDIETGDLSITPAALRELCAGPQKVLIIDVREAADWRAGHIPSATHMPLSTLGLDLAELPPLTRLIAVCADGTDSRLAARFLRYRGMEDSWFLAGGLPAWQAAGGAWST